VLRRVTQLAALEVVGNRSQTFDDATALIRVSVSVQLTNTGVVGQLVSASVSGTNAERMLLLSIGTVALGTVGFATAPEPGAELLTVTTSPTVLLGSPVILVNFECGDLAGTQTFQVSFQPDCGQPAVCSFIVVFEG
jgi:hypothetical protein